jgi:penicillin-insensitive murein DD-endopeptidase
VHDDHIHVRTACSAEEMVAGCEAAGPRRSWLAYDLHRAEDRDEDLALALFQPLEPGASQTSETAMTHVARSAQARAGGGAVSSRGKPAP